MKNKLLSIILISLALLLPTYVHAASLSEACFPAVQCDAGEDYYDDDCRPRINTISSCSTGNAFDCDNGCYTRSRPKPIECPGGVKIAGTCYTLLDIIDHNNIFKIWDGRALSRLVYIADTACNSGEVPTWDGSKWSCGSGGGGSGFWVQSGNNIYNKNTGNVGIGITNPTLPLTVEGNNGPNGVALFKDKANHANVLINAASGKDANVVLKEGTDNLWSLGSTGTGNASSNERFRIRPKNWGTEVLSILQKGYVGIGITNPPTPLSVSGSGATGGTALFMDKTSNTNVLLDSISGKDTNILFKENATPQWIIGNVGSDNDRFRLSQGWSTEMLTVLKSGNIGIGTKNPAYKFDVSGAVNLNKGINNTGALYVNSKEALWSDGNIFSWGYGGTANYFADKVGVGTNSPSAMLDVEVSNGGAATIGSSSNVATGNYAVAIGDGATASGESSFAAGSLSTASGKNSVAIGPGSDATKEYSVAVGPLTDATGYGAVALGTWGESKGEFSTTTGFNTFANGDSSTAMGYRLTVNGKNSFAVNANANFETVNSSNVIALLGDKIGIDTPSPSYKLDVSGAVNLNKNINSTGALYVNGKEALWSDGNYFSWGYENKNITDVGFM